MKGTEVLEDCLEKMSDVMGLLEVSEQKNVRTAKGVAEERSN